MKMFWAAFWPCFNLGLAIGAGIGVASVLEAAAPAPTFIWHLVTIAAGCLVAAAVAAISRPLRGVATALATAGAMAAFWPTVAIVAAL